jgi:hypothetical protein
MGDTTGDHKPPFSIHTVISEIVRAKCVQSNGNSRGKKANLPLSLIGRFLATDYFLLVG